MALPVWLSLRHLAVAEALAGVEHSRPWDDDVHPVTEVDPDVVAEAEAFLRAHSAMRDREEVD